MRRLTFLVLAILVCAPDSRCQTAPADSQTLQALLAEVRELRQELHIATVIAQRMQILIYRLQAQEAAVARASQRLEDVRSKVAQKEDVRKGVAHQLKYYEGMKDGTENSVEQRKYEGAISDTKAQVEALMAEEQELQSREAECREDLRTEESKLGRLQDDLDRLDKSLENSGKAEQLP